MIKPWKITNIYDKVARARTKYVFNEGGTRSSKTITNLQAIYKFLENNPNRGILASIVSESWTHMERGAYKDFIDFLLKEHGFYDRSCHNMSYHRYNVKGNTMEFFGADDAGKVHGPGRHILYCNELQNMRYETFVQLVIRTQWTVYADWNPVGDFWVHEHYIDNPEMQEFITFIHSTYKDNPYLPQSQIDEILRIGERDQNFKDVYILGKRGRLQGLVFPNTVMAPLHEWPSNLERRGISIDTGFSNDPTAIIETGMYMGEVCTRCLHYEVGMTTNDIFKVLLKKRIRVVSDIDPAGGGDRVGEELRRLGIKVGIANKREIIEGVDMLRQYKIKIFCESKDDHYWKERNNYIFKYDKRQAKFTNQPVDHSNHCFDGLRYWAYRNLKPKPKHSYNFTSV